MAKDSRERFKCPRAALLARFKSDTSPETPTSSSAAGMTTSVTKPASRASSAETWRPVAAQ